MKTALCVIDVQPRFSGGAKEIVPAVVHQIGLAIKREAPILLVEYGEHDSYEEVYEAYYRSKLHLRAIVKKTEDDGSDKVIAKMRELCVPFNCIRLCGVNTCACVKRTALGIKYSGLFKRVEIVKNATNCSYHNKCYKDTRLKVLQCKTSK